MPTELVIHSFSINQIVTNHICPFHYITWSSHNLTWTYNSPCWKRMWPYFTIMFINFINTCFFLFIITFKNILNPEHQNQEIPTKQLLMSGFLSLISVLSLIPDWLFMTSGKEWIYAMNWVYETEQNFKRKNLIRLKFWRSFISGNNLKNLSIEFYL